MKTNPFNLSPEEAAEIQRRLREQLATTAEVAEALGVTEFAVMQWRLTWDPYTAEERRRYAEQADSLSGLGKRQMAAFLGVSIHTLYSWRRPDQATRASNNPTGSGAASFSEEKVRQAVDMVRGGSSLPEAATAVGASAASVRRWCREARVAPTAAGGRPRTDQAVIDEVVAVARAEGVAAAVERFDVTRATVYRWLRASEISPT